MNISKLIQGSTTEQTRRNIASARAQLDEIERTLPERGRFAGKAGFSDYRDRNIARLIELMRDHIVPDWSDIDWVRLYQEHVAAQQSKATKRAYRAAGPRFAARAAALNNRAHKKGIADTVTADELEAIMVAAGEKCQRCNSQEHLVFDHIVPHYKGGQHIATNLQVLCRKCNMEKGVS